MSNYPSAIDTDAQLPRVDDNVSEIAAEVINGLREAIFAIQKTLGRDPQGSATDLVTRLSTSINDDGTLKAAALAISGIVNSQIAAGAAIEESKLDLDVPTQTLQDQITSNDIDIANLQKSIAKVISDLALHVSGAGLRHDTFDIDLNSAYPTSTPPEFTNLTSTDLHDALVEINDRFISHAATNAVNSHPATSISVDGSNFIVIPTTVDDVQEALEELDAARNVELIKHRDHLHANGFDNWANNIIGYNENLQLVPNVSGATVQAELITGTRNQIRFPGYNLVSAGVKQGSVVVVADGYAAGSYVIDDVGPRSAIGSKSLLNNTDAEIQSVFKDGYLITDGYVNASIFGQSSLFTYKGNVASTIHTSSATLDSLQLSRPNAARVITLGMKPNLLSGGETLDVEVGLDNGSIRTTSIALSGSATIDTIVSDLNTSFHGTDAFPAAAYRVGDEVMLSHNWDGYVGNYIKILDTGTANTILGFDGYGADVVGLEVHPSNTSKYYVNGFELTGFKEILNDVADISGTTITFSNFNPEASEIKPGNLIHVKNHPTISERGTYFITSISPTSVSVHTSIAAASDVSVEIQHDAVPLVELSNTSDALIVEAFLDNVGRAKYNVRSEFDKSIANLNIVNVSDNFIPGSYTLNSTVVSGGHELQFGSIGVPVEVPTGFVGQKRIYSEPNVEFIDVDILGALSASAASVVVNPHIDEEEVLEIASLRTNGLESLGDVKDKRLFGTIGLDEIREDVIQAYIETPLAELRSNGIVRGFDIIDDNYVDFVYPTFKSLLIRGGVVYVEGVRCDVRTQTVVFPNTAGTFFVVLNRIGVYEIIDSSVFTLSEVIEGVAGEYALIAQVVHDGADITSATDLRFFVDKLDAKVDLLVDETNNFLGTFGTFEAALSYANNMPDSERPLIRVISRQSNNISIPSGSREITLELDGYINNLTIASPCKVKSRSIGDRTSAHIQGTLTTSTGCSILELDHLKVDGAVSITDATYVKVNDSFIESTFTMVSSTAALFENSEFSDQLTLANEARFTNCKILTTSGDIANSGTTVLSNCIFDEASLTNTSETLISNCLFENHSAAATIVSVDGYAFMQSCIARNMSISSGVMFDFSTGAEVSECLFQNLTFSSSGRLIDANSVSNCLFDGNTYTSNPVCVVSNQFTNNVLTVSTNEALITAETFSNNVGFHAVNGSNLKIVNGNVFPNSGSLGYSVDVTSVANAVVSNNHFTEIVASGNAISCSSTSEGLTVIGNYFQGGQGTHTGISVTNCNEIKIIGNTFETNCDVISTSAQVDGLMIVDNTMLTTQNETWTIGDNFTFSNNSKSGLIILAGGSAASNARIIGNVLTQLETNVALADSMIIGNSMSFRCEANLTDTVISSNQGAYLSPVALTWDRVIFANNHCTFSSSSNTTLLESLIVNNQLETSSVTFTISSTGGNDPALVNISNNSFLNSVTITATNEIDNIIFANNVSYQVAAPSLTISDHINNSFIFRNSGFAITLSDGADSTIISSNNLSSYDISLSGNINSTSVDNNFVDNIVGDCNSPSGGLSISNNTVFDSIDVFDDNSSTYRITGAKINSNRVVNDITIGQNGVPSASEARFVNSVISNNTALNILFFPSDGYMDMSQNNIIGNNISSLQFFNNTDNFDQDVITVSDITISANNIFGTNGLVFYGGTTASGSDPGPLLQDIVITGNTLNKFAIESLIEFNRISLTSNTVNSTILKLEPRNTGVTFESFIISGNIIKGDITLDILQALTTVDGFLFTNNLMKNQDFIFESSTLSSTTILFSNFIFSNNYMRSISLEASTSIVFNPLGGTISSNFFAGDSGATKGVGWEPGVYLETSNASAVILWSKVNFINNGSQSEFVAVETNGDLEFSSCVFANNQDMDFELDAFVVGCNFSQNVNCNFTFEQSLLNVIINNNTMTTLGTNLTMNTVASDDIDSVIISENLFDEINLAPSSLWTTSTRPCKILNNHAETGWATTSSTFTNSDLIWCWGNTGNSATSVTMSGATSRTIANTNDLTAGTIAT